jgi:Ca-activated chloride channel family protein
MGLSHLSALHFLHPAWLLALPALLGLTAWLTRAANRDGNWSGVVDSQLLPLLRVNESRRGHSPWILVGSIWTLAVLALASPAWKRTESAAFRAPAAWVLVLDLSPSMAAGDLPPNRVTRARYAAADLLSAAHDARVGLVAFAGEPHTVAPLTTDVATVRTLLQPLAPKLMPESGDKMAPALEEAERLLRAGSGQHGQVVVLSDGSDDPLEAIRVAERLRKQGTTVNIVGVGTRSGAPDTDGNGGFVRNGDGRPRITRIQTDELRRVAAAGGGEFVPVNGVSSLISTLESARAHSMDASEAAPGARLATWDNEGVWLLPPLLLLAALLARRGWL